MSSQRRGRSIAMTPDEVDDFLATERVCRIATVGGQGEPHVTPLWFVWDGTDLWLNSLTRSQRWTDIERDARVAVIVDAGHDFMELRGVELTGTASVVGDVPRTAATNTELEPVERAFARKYAGGDEFQADGRHAWLRIHPQQTVSWDFRKMGLQAR